MTISYSPTSSTGRLLPNQIKGSTYGKQEFCWSNLYPFLEPSRDGGFNDTYGVEVLPGKATIRALRQISIIQPYDNADSGRDF